MQKKKELLNFLYIRSLKFKNPQKVDKIAKTLHREAFEKIDCTKCGNCCKTIQPLITFTDIKQIANFLKISTDQVKTEYLEKDQDGDWTFNKLPCPFLLSDNLCKIYDSRPKDCREFPHTHKKEFSTRSHMHSSNIVVCPAVYFIVENMKKRIR